MTPPDLREFLNQWKESRVVVRFEILSEKPSEALKGYYFHCVVPTMKTALWESGERKNEQQTENWLREMSPITHHCEWRGFWDVTIKDIAELSNAEFVEHIEFIRQMAAEEFSVYIEEPQTIIAK
jgi:hypothetical protein